jgi:hypothetical protein
MGRAAQVVLAVIAAFVLVVVASFTGLFGGDDGAGAVSTDSSGSDAHIVPEMRRMGLGVADEVAQDGAVGLQPYDSLGKGRDVDEPQEWKVCYQSPNPGSYEVPVTALVGVVMVDEACPAQDHGVGPAMDPEVMPDFVGRPAHLVRTTLGESASIRYRDEDGGGTVSEDDLGDFFVCAQNPAAGAEYNGVPVTVDLNKMPERC